MSLPVVTPFPADGDPNFNSSARACMASLRDFSLQAGAAMAGVSAAYQAVTSGLSAGLWVSGTTYAVGDLRYSPADGLLYRRLIPGGGVTDPSADTTNWAPMYLPEYQLHMVSTQTVTVAARGEWVMLHSSPSEATLPASPAVGDSLRVYFANGRTDNILRRGGELLLGQAEDMLIDIPHWGRRLRFWGGAIGWGVTR